LHWVSAEHALDAEVRLYDRLFSAENPNDGDDITSTLNKNSLEVVRGAKLEPSLATVALGSHFQFERLGYFCPDARDSKSGQLVWNRTIELRDTWAKIEEKERR
jgi:glutaminyl-tRNA synthetase